MVAIVKVDSAPAERLLIDLEAAVFGRSVTAIDSDGCLFLFLDLRPGILG
jgi:hypothetical protein